MRAADLERIEYWRPAELQGVEVMRVDDVARRWSVFHETYTICTVLDAVGEAEFRYRGKLHRAKAGDTLLMEPGEAHSNTRITPPGTFRVLFIAPVVFERAASEAGLPRAGLHWKYATVSHPGLFAAFAALHASLEGGGAGALERQSRFAACLKMLFEYCTEIHSRAPHEVDHPGLHRCREFIAEHFASALSLDELAAVAGLGRFQLVRGFTRAFGIAPHAYQVHLRIEKARGLLSAGMSSASVAAETGFADQSHFGRHFMHITGMTPAHYARNVRGESKSLPPLGNRLRPSYWLRGSSAGFT